MAGDLAFFVQNNYVTALTVPVALYARTHGLALEDRSSNTDFDPDNCGIDWSQYSIVLPYGSVQFLRKLRASSSLAPFVHLDATRFAASTWAPLFGNRALNEEGMLIRAHEVSSLLTSPMHLRPDSEDKAFAGGVFTKEAWQSMTPAPSPQLACWVSPLQEILAEWRCWVVGRKVVEISRYRQAGEHNRKRETDAVLLASAQGFADVYVPAPCVVMDLALTKSGLKIVEFNPINCSGWYAADVGRILAAWVRWESLHCEG